MDAPNRSATEPPHIALCLSGGGYRAALFHLGAVRRLNELGLLAHTDVISAVSGGSILAAHLAQSLRPWPVPGGQVKDFENAVANPFRTFCSNDIRTEPILRRAWPWNWLRSTASVNALAAVYERELVQLNLEDLPERPRIIFCATDMAFGANWVFEKRAMGSYQAGFLRPAPKWPIARAVAASSCFPPIFGPLRPKFAPDALQDGRFPQGAERNKLIAKLHLTDGGVYDNLGLEPVTGSQTDPRILLVSDGGGTIRYEIEDSVLWRVQRYSSILQDQVGKLRRRFLVAQFKTGELSGAYWGISSAVQSYDSTWSSGYPKDLAVMRIARVRTDLDAFSADEAGVLENHGYWLADAAVRKHVLPKVKHLDGISVPALTPPRPDLADAAAVEKVLKNSHRRVLFGRKR